MYSSLLDRMIAWPSDADDYCRLTAKRLSWHSRILQREMNSYKCTASVGGRLSDKLRLVHHSCIALACALWPHVNTAVHIHFRDRLQSGGTSTIAIYAEETCYPTARLRGRWQELSIDVVFLWIHVQLSTWQNDIAWPSDADDYCRMMGRLFLDYACHLPPRRDVLWSIMFLQHR